MERRVSDSLRGAAAPPSASQKFVYVAAIFAGLGGLLFGYDTGVISGAELFLRNDFTLTSKTLETIVSGVLVGAAVGALSGGRFADRFGRRKLLIFTAIIFAAGALVCAAATSVAMLVAGRIVVGLGIGLASGTVPVYISEVAPAEARGWQVSLFQLAITVGILLAYLVDLAFAQIQSWRWMLGIAVVPAAIFGTGMIFLPESPRWLAKQGLTAAARETLARIRGGANIEAEMRGIEESLHDIAGRGGLRDLLQRSLRPALAVGIGLAIFQQITGINTVIYYAPLIIQSAGISSASGAILATAGIGVVNVVMTIVSMWLLDRVGRRPLLLVGIAGMIVTLAALGATFHALPAAGAVGAGGTGAANSPIAHLAVISMMVYVASFAISLGPIFWLLIAEIYPVRIRSSAQGLAATFNWAANLAVTFTFLTMLQAIGAAWTFWAYALAGIAAFVFSYYMVPETRGKTLEEIERSWQR